MSVSSLSPDRPAGGAASPDRTLADRLAWLVLLALGLWAAAPVVYLLLRAWSHNESLTGADSLFAADQLQYMSWIRSSGEHLLAANGFDLHAGGHVFLHPMFVLSGLLWRAGVGIALSYLVWMPVAVAVVFFGFWRYTRRMLDSRRAQVATLVLAVFFVTPADPLVGWTVKSTGLGVLGGELSPASILLGYFPDAIALGLMPLYMLGLERIAHADRERTRGSEVRAIAGTALIGLLISWLHPWQGETLLLVTGVVLAAARFRRSHWMLLVPGIAAAIPLLYYFVLTKVDTAWSTAQVQSAPPLPSPLLLVLALAPLLVFAAAGVRGPRHRTSAELIVIAWPACGLLVYFFSTGYSAHALEGLSLPLSVLAARGWHRLRLPAWAAVAAIAVATLPGLVFDLQALRDAALAPQQELLFQPDQREALTYLDHLPGPGGVLPSLNIAAAVPAYTGRRTWLGHLTWTPDYAARAQVVTELFSGQLSVPAAQALLRQVGARYVLADCQPQFDARRLGALLVAERRFGCVTVYRAAVNSTAAEL